MINELEEVKKWVKKYKPLLKLSEWKIDVMYEPKTDKDYYLEVTFESVEYKLAKIKISDKYKELDKEDREQTVIHELCHIILQPMEDVHREFEDTLIEFFNKMRISLNEKTNEHYAQAMWNIIKRK